MTTTNNSPLYTAIRTTALAYITSFTTARTQNNATLLNTVCAPDCKRFYSPISLQSLLPPSFSAGESNTHYAIRMQVELDTTSQSRETDIRQVVVDEGQRKAVVNAVLWNKSVKTGREYAFEFAFFFDLDGEGRLVERVQVFADPGMAKRFFEGNEEVGESVKD
ncbi:hypothetical protein M409DRAFT_25016 [Zasmidium cellare ATCC 36951]|uniref:SnoaL-like domain-containing protein n=1 Tax=Zasmidium cellare ATCC 36951 TaxID=1080233 RepID=A0A6A6CG29_ZASCE|nr:uncharacterized protein M409DRAFT_25016 [Zasmidium cellare ATCC 36951]KAF2164619.1 hypothetical protein M409DRAFT_25016 [Zasmidium cellare ATCC 36951]